MHQLSSTAPPRTRTRPRGAGSRRLAGAGLALVLGLGGLAACTQEAPEPTPSPTATGQADGGITDIVDAPGTGEGLEGALSDTQVTTCQLADDQWKVDGTVTNSTEASASYRIYVSLLTAAGDTRSLTQVNVDPIAPGAETEWSTTVALDEEDLSCVLRVERYAAAVEPTDEETNDSEG